MSHYATTIETPMKTLGTTTMRYRIFDPQATGLAISTVTKGRNELRAGASAVGLVKVRRSGGGRPKHEKVYVGLVDKPRLSLTH